MSKFSDERLDALLADARDTYRVPAEPPVDDMWADIDARLTVAAGGGMPARRATSWSVAGYAAAAALVLGVAIGRFTAPAVAPSDTVADVGAPGPRGLAVNVAEPLQRTATAFLGETEALLRDMQRGENRGTYASQATTLLMTSRLLLDSQAASDPRLRDLLEDLELLLAQIATLRADDARTRELEEERRLILNALANGEVVSRVRTAVVSLASYDD